MLHVRFTKGSRFWTILCCAFALSLLSAPAQAAFELIELEGAPGLGKTYQEENLATSGTSFAENTLSGWPVTLVTDGSYDRNSSSWIANATTSFVGVALESATTVDRVAFTNPFNNRAQGTYAVQVTTVASPDASTPDSSWTTVGTLTVSPPYPTRRLVQFTAVANVTGVRLDLTAPSVPIALSELEVYAYNASPSTSPLTVDWDVPPGSGASHDLTNVATSGTAYEGIASIQDNPGNIFDDTETVQITPTDAMVSTGASWDLRDVDGTVQTTGSSIPSEFNLGTLAPGWYKITAYDSGSSTVDTIYLAVLDELTTRPLDSPVAVDTAVSWKFRRDAQGQATLIELAKATGVNWIRDRMTWGDIMPTETAANTGTTYDSAAMAAEQYDVDVVSTFHSTPSWAQNSTLDPTDTGGRFPRDLFDLYDWCELLTTRYTGQIGAWEPWNEANIVSFGGHLIDEQCSLQKAAYWGLTAGDSNVHVCWNNYSGVGKNLHATGVVKNEAWSYFDSYNFHMYAAPSSYEEAFSTIVDGACGRPVWMTECGIQLAAATAGPEADLSSANEVAQARFIPVSVATAIWAGVDKYFFFILGNHYERGFQYGLLRDGDLTPRPGYVSLATTGRLLADAVPLGRELDGTNGTHIYAFDAKPAGTSRDVLVMWADSSASWPLAGTIDILSIHDLYGREITTTPTTLDQDPVFVTCPANESSELTLESPVAAGTWRTIDPCPVVMQVRMNQSTARLAKQAYEIATDTQVTVPVQVYNFGSSQADGTLSVTESPTGWSAAVDSADTSVSLAAGTSQAIDVNITIPSSGTSSLYGDWITVTGDFGTTLGDSVVAFRVAADPADLTPSTSTLISASNTYSRWASNIVSGGTLSITSSNGGVLFDMSFPDNVDPWCYPRFDLQTSEEPSADVHGLKLDAQLLSGSADATVRVLFAESGGASYLCETGIPRSSRTLHNVVVLFQEATWMPASSVDSDGQLTAADITSVKVGVNGTANAGVDLWIKDLTWVEYSIPAAPTGLSASTAGTTQISLSWTDNADDETGFKIERSPDGASSWSQIGTTSANATSYSSTGLSADTTYYYRVRAYNGFGNSDYSGTANATTGPAAPTSLSATAASTSQIDLSWTDNASNESGFKVERSPDGSSSWTQITTVGSNVTSYSNTGLTANTTYYYRVRAYNGTGNSDYSNTANASTPDDGGCSAASMNKNTPMSQSAAHSLAPLAAAACLWFGWAIRRRLN